MFERLKEVPGSLRAILAIVTVALTVLNDRFLHLSPEQLNTITTTIITLIVGDTVRQVGGRGLTAFPVVVGTDPVVSNQSKPNEPTTPAA